VNLGKLIQTEMDTCINVKNAIPKKAIDGLIHDPVMNVISSNGAALSNKLVPSSDIGWKPAYLWIGPRSRTRLYDSDGAVIKKTPR